jgi:hypothetical protein
MEPKKSASKFSSALIYVIAIVLTIVLVASFLPNFGLKIEVTQLVLATFIVILLLFKYFDILEIPGFLKLSKKIEHIESELITIRQNQISIQQNAISQKTTASNQVFVSPIVNQVINDAEKDAELFLSNSLIEGVSADEIKTDTYSIETFAKNGEYSDAFSEIRKQMLKNLDIIIGNDSQTKGLRGKLTAAFQRGLISEPLFQSLLSVRRVVNVMIGINPHEMTYLNTKEVNKVIELAIESIKRLETISRKLS